MTPEETPTNSNTIRDGTFLMHGFEAYAIDELSGDCNRVSRNDLTAVESVNIFFCPANSRAAARVKS